MMAAAGGVGEPGGGEAAAAAYVSSSGQHAQTAIHAMFLDEECKVPVCGSKGSFGSVHAAPGVGVGGVRVGRGGVAGSVFFFFFFFFFFFSCVRVGSVASSVLLVAPGVQREGMVKPVCITAHVLVEGRTREGGGAGMPQWQQFPGRSVWWGRR